MTGIRYIKRGDLNVAKWDQCISDAPNGLIYAYSFYLDAMCDNWDALVLGHYEAVMPLPWRKKWGITYLYQPSFVNALGVFATRIAQVNVDLFINSIPEKFKYWDLDLNERSGISSHSLKGNKLKIKIRHNYLIQLSQPHEILFNNYRRLAKRKLNKALESGVSVRENVDPKKVIFAYANSYAEKHPDLPAKAYRELLAFCHAYPNSIKTYLACYPNGETAAFYLLLKDDRYIYSLLGGSTASGKEAAAFYLLTDAAIKDHAGSRKAFRFEGSDIPGIAFFNQQFGSCLVTYSYLNYNGLPWPLKHVKK